MTRKYKIIVIILILGLCSAFIGEKRIEASVDVKVKRIKLQMDYINKHNIINDNIGVKYIGHRGIGGLAPENTLPAFELAGKLGFWGAECDVRTTSDGNWMILHDDTVDRMTNGNGQIKDLSLQMVQSLNITSGSDIADYNGTKIAKLQDYLLVCKKWGVVPIIEMKVADNLQYYDKFIKILKEYGDIDKTVVISFSTTSLSELRKRDTYLTLGLLCSDITESNINYVKTLQNAFIDSSFDTITKSKVNLCHKKNIKVGAWTVDDRITGDSLIEKGVDYLTTDTLLPEAKEQEVFTN